MLLLVDGPACWDPAWRWALGSGCVLVVVGEWLPPLAELEPWVHFVPAKADLSDLDERVLWAMRQPEADALACAAQELHGRMLQSGHTERVLAEVFAEVVAGGDQDEPL